MKHYKNLTVIGTSHISVESVNLVEKVIMEEKPGIVALELDKLRFLSLISNKKKGLRLKDLKMLGLKGFLFNLIGAWIEKKIGQLVGTPPGSDMLKAIKVSKEINANIALIDQDIRITLKKLSKTITLKEKLRFPYDIIKSFFVRKPIINFDLRKVPSDEIIKKLLNKVKKDYPSFYKVLVEERNEVMSKSLYKLMSLDKRIVAVVGAGHEESIIQLVIKGFEK